MRRLWQAVLVALALALAGPAAAQQAAPPQGTPVLVIDQDRLFSESLFGERVTEEIERRSAALAAENREIESELIAEEQDLTERRPEMAPEAFRELADAFDEKVQRLRRQQDEKARALARLRDEARAAFVEKIVPILSDLVRDRGGLVVLERRSVFLSADAIDITDAAIARIDEAVGSGELSVLSDDEAGAAASSGAGGGRGAGEGAPSVGTTAPDGVGTTAPDGVGTTAPDGVGAPGGVGTGEAAPGSGAAATQGDGD